MVSYGYIQKIYGSKRKVCQIKNIYFVSCLKYFLLMWEQRIRVNCSLLFSSVKDFNLTITS